MLRWGSERERELGEGDRDITALRGFHWAPLAVVVIVVVVVAVVVVVVVRVGKGALYIYVYAHTHTHTCIHMLKAV